MKISVCLYGDIKKSVNFFNNWEKLFLRFKNHKNINSDEFYVDFFLHSWDFNKITKNKLNQKDILDFIRLVNPKAHVLDDFETYLNRTNFILDIKNKYPEYSENLNALRQNDMIQELYGIFRVSNLKRKHEVQYNFEYDVCFLLNTECDISDINSNIIHDHFDIPEYKSVCVGYSKNLTQTPHIFIDTNILYSDSETFDIICQLYNFLPFIKNSAFFGHNTNNEIGYVLPYYLRMLGVKIKRINVDVTNSYVKLKNVI